MIDGFTPEQQFFIALGQYRGDAESIELQREMLKADPHPVPKYRVIGPLSNSPEFQRAFACGRIRHGEAARAALRGLVAASYGRGTAGRPPASPLAPAKQTGGVCTRGTGPWREEGGWDGQAASLRSSRPGAPDRVQGGARTGEPHAARSGPSSTRRTLRGRRIWPPSRTRWWSSTSSRPVLPQATAEDLSRREFQAGAHRFCIEKGDPWFEHLRLEDGEGRAVVDLDASAECDDVHLEAGDLSSAAPPPGNEHHRCPPARILPTDELELLSAGRRRCPAARLVGAGARDPTGKGRRGRLHALPPPRDICDGGTCYLPALPIVADFSSQPIDDTALFDFSHLGGEGISGPYLVPGIVSALCQLDLTYFLPGSSVLIAPSDRVVRINNKFLGSALNIVNLGNGKVQLQEFELILFKYVPFFIDVDAVVKWSDKPPQLPYMNQQVLFRILFPGDPEYAQAAPAEGEAALYQGCNYTGPVTMFSVSTPNLSALTSSAVTLDRTTASVKDGPNVAITLFSEAGYGGTQFGSTIDQPCLDGTPIGRNTRSFRLTPALQVFIATHSCEGCNLSGLDLAGLVGSGAFLLNANLSGATLNRTILHAARSLSGTDFSNATITCSNFSGTDRALVDLTQAALSLADFNADIS